MSCCEGRLVTVFVRPEVCAHPPRGRERQGSVSYLGVCLGYSGKHLSLFPSAAKCRMLLGRFTQLRWIPNFHTATFPSILFVPNSQPRFSSSKGAERRLPGRPKVGFCSSRPPDFGQNRRELCKGPGPWRKQNAPLLPAPATLS